jgi:glutaredoxin
MISTMQDIGVKGTMFDEWFDKDIKTEKTLSRTDEEQAHVDKETSKMVLYHYETCMFCARVKKTIRQLKLNIRTRDIHLDENHMRELVTNGGKPTVPCLRIERPDGTAIWQYESSDIRNYLLQKFG